MLIYSILPAVNTAIQSEIRGVTSAQIPGAIHDALSSVPRELEKALGPVIQRSVATIVQTSVSLASRKRTSAHV